MKIKPHFLIVSHAAHKINEGSVYAYAPYIKEINLWGNHVNKITIIAPRSKNSLSPIDANYTHENIQFVAIPSIGFTSLPTVLFSILKLPYIFIILLWYTLKCDHIHLRCPGNIGMAGCLVQILFPKKSKTAKYAGNWDPQAEQPWTYKLQRSILSNTFWTKNMKVLVYGSWPNQTKNILAFFTATYATDESSEGISVIQKLEDRSFNSPWRFVFVGSLTKGKRPLYAAQLVCNLVQENIDCTLRFYGDGEERDALEAFIKENDCQSYITLLGNQGASEVKKAFQESQFQLLPSKSEGWPKVVAEAMFWGCIPMVTPISCVPWMLDNEKRGVLLSLELETDSAKIQTLLTQKETLVHMSKTAAKWSRKYTLETFEKEIAKLL